MDELFKGRHFDREIIVLCVRWYLRYKLSFRDLVEMMAERGLPHAHTTIMRWIRDMCRNSKSAGIAMLAKLDAPGASMRRTSKSEADGPISTVPSTKRAKPSTSGCAQSGTLPRPRHSSGLLSGVRADSTSTVIRSHIAQPKRPWTNIPREINAIRPYLKYSNNLIEQDHRSVKLRLGPMLGLKHFRQAATTIAGIELMHRIRKGQFKLGRLGTKGNTAPKIWNAVLAA